MKLITITLVVTSWALVLVCAGQHEDFYHCGNKHHHSARATPLRGTTLKGTPSPPSPILITGGDEQDEEGLSFPLRRPLGPIVPFSQPTNLTGMNLADPGSSGTVPSAKRQLCGEGSSILFARSTVFGNNTGQSSEPSGAIAGNIIFTTPNFIATASFDGGATFYTFNPTVYSGPANPATDGGFCCDQIVQYLLTIDRFAWLMQYWNNSANQDKLRLITFHPSDLTTAGINSWLYLDILSIDLNLVNLLDAGELAVGNDYLWLSANNNNNDNTGLVVLRIPIASLDVVGSLTYWHTDTTLGHPAYLSRLSQNPGDTLFWAGHTILGTTMRVFKWPESGTTYFWSDIRIRDWPSSLSNYAAFCPADSSTDWTFSADFKAVLGSTRRTTSEVWFAWAAPSGGSFPNVHIQIAQIDVSNWPDLVLINQPQIWKPGFAFVYPALYTNLCGDVGLAVMFGGGAFNPSSAVGIMTSAGVLTNTVYYPELSNVCEARYGDYVTVRSANGTGFEAVVYAEQSVGGLTTRYSRYMEFRRG